MNLDHATTFLESTARSSGLAFEPDALKAAAAELAATVDRDAAGTFSYTPAGYSTAFRLDKGQQVEIPVGETVAILIRRHAQAAAPKAQAQTPAPPAPSSAPDWTRFSRGPVTDFAKAFAAAEDAKILREIATWANPWAKGQENRTRQAVISNRNPALAAQFKAQAGV
ncbi:hypothetical protein [Methylobacterium oryzae]|uniref:hypothetical protein n=1 Tax=Methylobacterium oryzae TaxID=334852 RepID=UPI001F39D5A2|nr:hypothetical protein [Methylobacterium oryzae]UIN36390.1 hypothetical protein LXM90_07805 [Methylobacterium oryzae]